MLEGMHYNAMKANKIYSHIRSIRLLTKKHEEIMTSTLTRSIRWLTNISKNKQANKEIKHVKNTMITKNHYLIKNH